MRETLDGGHRMSGGLGSSRKHSVWSGKEACKSSGAVTGSTSVAEHLNAFGRKIPKISVHGLRMRWESLCIVFGKCSPILKASYKIFTIEDLVRWSWNKSDWTTLLTDWLTRFQILKKSPAGTNSNFSLEIYQKKVLINLKLTLKFYRKRLSGFVTSVKLVLNHFYDVSKFSFKIFLGDQLSKNINYQFNYKFRRKIL